jgi:hypothetical protein
LFIPFQHAAAGRGGPDQQRPVFHANEAQSMLGSELKALDDLQLPADPGPGERELKVRKSTALQRPHRASQKSQDEYDYRKLLQSLH